MSTLLARFQRHLDRGRLLTEPGTALAAVSGGADSVALLDLLSEVAAARGVSLVVGHLDHGISGDSAAVAEAVRDLAAQYHLPFELGQLAPPLGPGASETAARRARYAWLRDTQRNVGARYLVTAHHRDDQVETVLLRFLHGSGPAGLAGVPAKARGGLVRPLLPFTRAELEAHCAARGLAWHRDPANRDPRHLRSWIRTTLLPLIEQRIGGDARQRILDVGRQAARDRQAWNSVLDLLPGLELRIEASGFDVVRASLAGYDEVLAETVLRAAGRRVGCRLGERQARRLLELAGRPSGRRISLGAGWSGEVAFDRLRVRREGPAPVTALAPAGERGRATFGGWRVGWEPEPAPPQIERGGWRTWIPGAGWSVRAPRAGDVVLPLGGVGHRPLRRLLMEARVPRSDRASYPVVVRGETILWVPGICRSAEQLPDPGTPAVRLDVTERSDTKADGRDQARQDRLRR